MQKISLQQAVKMTGKSESTLRRDVKKGKVSAERDDRRRLRFDISELQRAYGELKATGEDAQLTEQGIDKVMTGHDQAEILAIKDNQLADLRNQLDKAEAQLQIATTEKTKLLDLLSAEKDEKRELKAEMLALMPPPEERQQKTAPTLIKPRGWLQRLLGA
jgi:PDZ domain-containing secreted protein